MSGIVSKNGGRSSGIVGAGAIGADAVDGSNIADDAIDSEHYTDGSIDNAHIADDAIDSEHYADGSIDNAHIADDAIDSEHYADGSIDNAHIADDAIDSEHYVDGSIDNAHIADDAIDSEHYAAASIDTAHIATNQIDETLMKDAFVGDFTDATVTASDYFIHGDATDSGNTKKDTVQGILDLVSAGGTTAGSVTATTSGTSVTFGSIPTGTKRVDLIFNGCGMSHDTDFIVQIGDAGGIETSGYISCSANMSGSVQTCTDVTDSYMVQVYENNATLRGVISMYLVDATNHDWVSNHTMGETGPTEVVWGGGAKSLSAELTQIQITLGAGAYDSGEMNIHYWQ